MPAPPVNASPLAQPTCQLAETASNRSRRTGRLDLALGAELSILALFFSFIFGGFMSLILLVTKEVADDHMIPFGPSITAATLLTILTKTVGGGNYIINWYFTNMWNGEYFF